MTVSPTIESLLARPASTDPSRRTAGVVLAIYAAVVMATAVSTREVYDDPWILYRYAENLAAGHGWTFNPVR